MRLVRAGRPGAERPGVLDAVGRVRDLSWLTADIDGDFLSDPQRLAAARDALGGDRLAVVAAPGRLGAPVARPGKIVGIGLNYADHAAEAGVTPPEEPVVFLKASSTVVGPHDDLVLPGRSTHTDWEVELGVVVGTTLSGCSDPRAALAAVAGYVAVNDVTERAHAASGPTWAKGKCHDTFCPTGPWLLTADELPDPQHLGLGLWVNGTQQQRSSTAEMVFGVGELLAYVSGLMTLEPGDLLITGTPGGVANGRPEPKPFLRPGDVVELEVEGLGRQRTVVTAGRVAAGETVEAHDDERREPA